MCLHSDLVASGALMITILHTGQTGVERGADRAARAVGLSVRGFCQLDSRDELGAIADHIAADLTPVLTRGARTVWNPTLELADVLCIVVPDRATLKSNAGIGVLRTLARFADVPQVIADQTSDMEKVACEIRAFEKPGEDLAVMVCGPRATRWHEGERKGWQLVTALATTPQKHRVLVVDDHSETADMICNIVTLLGHQCAAATSGREALERADMLRPDIGLFDIRLPDLSGYELARLIRRSHTEPLFLAAITGWDEARDVHQAYAAGFDHHVVKPVGAGLIRGLIERACSRLDSPTIG